MGLRRSRTSLSDSQKRWLEERVSVKGDFLQIIYCDAGVFLAVAAVYKPERHFFNGVDNGRFIVVIAHSQRIVLSGEGDGKPK